MYAYTLHVNTVLAARCAHLNLAAGTHWPQEDPCMTKIQTLGYKIELVDLDEVRKLPKLLSSWDSEFSDEILREHAKADATSGIPTNDSSAPSPFERQLLHSAGMLVSSIASTYKRALEQVDAKIKAERILIEAKRSNALESAESTYHLEQQAAENAFGLKDSHKQLELAEARYNEIYSRYNRTPVVYIPHWIYVILAVAIFLGEVPLNAMVFQIFGENQVMCWVMALIIGLCIPVSAHFVGIKLREHGDGISWTNIAKGFVLIAIITAALYGLSIMRQTFLEANREALGLTPALISSSFMFFWLNLAVFGAAIVIAYLAHDPIPGYEQVRNEMRTLRKQVSKAEVKKVELLKQAAVRRVKTKDKAAEEHRDNSNRINLMKGTYDQLLREGQEWESRCAILLKQKISTYRHEQMKHRADKTEPRAFATEPALELELKKMREKLDNELPDSPH